MAVVGHVPPCVNEDLCPAEAEPVTPAGVSSHLLWTAMEGVTVDFECQPRPEHYVHSVGILGTCFHLNAFTFDPSVLEQPQSLGFEDARLTGTKRRAPLQSGPQCF